MILSASYPPAAEADLPYISAAPIDAAALLSAAHHPQAGAIVLFSGETRDHSHGKQVAWLEYEAHEALATKLIRDILEQAVATWDLRIAMAQHRIGRVNISESAVVVITASPHRAEAYAANRFIIDRIKHEAPIWKCEYFTDGTRQWGGQCHDGNGKK